MLSVSVIVKASAFPSSPTTAVSSDPLAPPEDPLVVGEESLVVAGAGVVAVGVLVSLPQALMRKRRASGVANASGLGTLRRSVSLTTGWLAVTFVTFWSDSLMDSTGAPVTTLKAGEYKIKVKDLSKIHNFNLSGAGVDEKTTVPEVTDVTWTVTFTAGTYTFKCDPHPPMTGSFTVT